MMEKTDWYCWTLTTLPGFWIRRALTAWKTSTVPSVLQQSMALLRAQSRPHLLTVSLSQCRVWVERVCAEREVGDGLGYIIHCEHANTSTQTLSEIMDCARGWYGY